MRGRHRSDSDPYAGRRARLLREIEAEVRETSRHLGKSTLDPRVLEAVSRVPRHEFVPEDERDSAYGNFPLSIGCGQTISQPYIVAVMTDLLLPQPDDIVLEIGTGCGYQTAILAELVGEVYSIEIVESLARAAAERLARLGYDNVHTRIGDGHRGWPEHAPFDGIIVTAGATSVPPDLVDQLRPGGRLVVPVQKGGWSQDLELIRKDADGAIVTRSVLPVAFVPLTGDDA
jgi:protein-L-isoaspartate(D-aspartate) O-methyltransferase